jgi:hypothetical protein
MHWILDRLESWVVLVEPLQSGHYFASSDPYVGIRGWRCDSYLRSHDVRPIDVNAQFYFADVDLLLL